MNSKKQSWPEWIRHYYRIDLKETPDCYYGERLPRVLPSSAWLLRREVEKFAHYFRREFHYDSVQFGASWRGPYTAYILPSRDGLVWAGACCFQEVFFRDLDVPTESLEWLWIHPYFRRRGILNSHWSAFRANHGDFYIEHPLSPAMKEFLLKCNRGSMWYPMFEGKELDLVDIRRQLLTRRQSRTEELSGTK